MFRASSIQEAFFRLLGLFGASIVDVAQFDTHADEFFRSILTPVIKGGTVEQKSALEGLIPKIKAMLGKVIHSSVATLADWIKEQTPSMNEEQVKLLAPWVELIREKYPKLFEEVETETKKK